MASRKSPRTKSLDRNRRAALRLINAETERRQAITEAMTNPAIDVSAEELRVIHGWQTRQTVYNYIDPDEAA